MRRRHLAGTLLTVCYAHMLAPGGDYLLASRWDGIRCVALPANTVVDSVAHGDRSQLAFSVDGDSLYVTTNRKVRVLGKRQHLGQP